MSQIEGDAMTNIDMLVADEARPALQQLATGQDIDGRRAAALLAVADGQSQAEAAAAHDLTEGQVGYIVRKFREQGLAAFSTAPETAATRRGGTAAPTRREPQRARGRTGADGRGQIGRRERGLFAVAVADHGARQRAEADAGDATRRIAQLPGHVGRGFARSGHLEGAGLHDDLLRPLSGRAGARQGQRGHQPGRAGTDPTRTPVADGQSGPRPGDARVRQANPGHAPGGVAKTCSTRTHGKGVVHGQLLAAIPGRATQAALEPQRRIAVVTRSCPSMPATSNSTPASSSSLPPSKGTTPRRPTRCSRPRWPSASIAVARWRRSPLTPAARPSPCATAPTTSADHRDRLAADTLTACCWGPSAWAKLSAAICWT
ncbi:MAG: helix-turn-helix domain-containing protein [Candidatus Promineofilum sp.]|nr:helix-turn-helix domain-containing protein [Promineifilum sp.]